MSKTLTAVAISLSLSMGGAVWAKGGDKTGEKTGETAAHRAMKHDWKNIEMHLKEHQKYPATKAELVATCNNLSDFSEEDKAWFAANLPEGTYSSPQDVVKALKKAK